MLMLQSAQYSDDIFARYSPDISVFKILSLKEEPPEQR